MHFGKSSPDSNISKSMHTLFISGPEIDWHEKIDLNELREFIAAVIGGSKDDVISEEGPKGRRTLKWNIN